MKRTVVETEMPSPTRLGDEQMARGEDVDLFKEGVVIDLDDKREAKARDARILTVCLLKALRTDLIQPWKNALIIKFFGQSCAFSLFQQQVLMFWNISGKI